jgi:hypothetical protein
MPKTTEEELQLQDGVVVTPATPAAADNNSKSASKPNKFIVELTVIADPLVNDEVTPPVTKYHLSQQTIAYLPINGKEYATVQARSMWLKLAGDNPLELEEGDTFELDKRNTRLTKSSWLANPDDPNDNTMYYTHWITPKEFTMQANHVLAEW